ncbi:MAG: Protein containing nucleotide-diphospho-sugar transferase protein, partial [uncultured bacterium]
MFIKPILFIIFNRPDTTLSVFEAIRQIKPARLYVAADGPRSERSGEDVVCAETRRIAMGVDWPCELKTRFLDKNVGCHTAVPAAVSWFFENEEEGIILEDDCSPDLSFFTFCETLLERYRDDEEVMMISGDNFQPSEFKTRNDSSYYFSGIANIWGWATWRRAWAKNYGDFKLMEN